MLPEFKKRIDTLRDILVGAVPSPAGQIEQITYALIYKFMSDIDDKSASLPGGKRTYFTGEYKKYDWHELMAPTLGAHDRLTLYREALGSLAKNPGLPELFQDIYQNAYLTFNDPRVLTLFLKEIDNFKHSSSDDIGDAYEYLLQITGAQGDVGQFRTPRHIIKFIVEAVNPTKSDSVLDPAVGTAGFLIAAYNHVKHHHDGIDDITGLPSDKEKRLTADEQNKMNDSYHGFDIDPTMVRTAKVNMYLHGFKTPDIKNHDSLSSEDWWNERYDVILANPPFMSPKGGIKPHDKFGIVANRAEVLFVDYIASHLKPTGRAGIVVPEGIIFQSGKAYKELRKNLVDNYLYAVVSLPAGIFQPYSGVKTSVLLLDKELAKQRDEVLFVKIENDGFSLGTQRREIAGSQFAEALELIESFKDGSEVASEFAHTVSRDKIAESGDYNLSGERYKAIKTLSSVYPIVTIGEIVSIDNGNAFKSSEYVSRGARVIRITNVQKGQIVDDSPKYLDDGRMSEFSKYRLDANDMLMSLTGNVGRVGLIGSELLPALLNQRVARLRPDETKVMKRYLFHVLNTDIFERDSLENSSGVAQKNLSTEWLKTYKIPLPPIEIQREIVAELDNYQNIIDAAQTIVKSYKPTIKISPAWDSARISDIFDKITDSWQPKDKNASEFNFYVGLENIESNTGHLTVSNDPYKALPASSKIWTKSGDILYGKLRPNLNKVAYSQLGDSICSTDILVLRPKDSQKTNAKLYSYFMREEAFNERVMAGISGSQLPRVKPDYFFNLTLPSVPSACQKQIVTELETEAKLIEANKKLIDLYSEKIKSKIAEVWGE